MDEKESTVRPVVQRGEGYRERQQRKQKFKGSDEEPERQEEKLTRRPAPLPFGKIDVIV